MSDVAAKETYDITAFCSKRFLNLRRIDVLCSGKESIVRKTWPYPLCRSFIFYMEIIDNVNKTLKEDMLATLREGSRLSIAASCFSIYAFQELKEQLSDISELRFIFTSPSFITEKVDKQKREFYIPRLNSSRAIPMPFSAMKSADLMILN